MKKNIIISHWGQELDRKIKAIESRISDLQKKLNNPAYSSAQVEIEIKSDINSLEQLNKRKAVYSPSCIIGQIDALQDEIASKSNEFEQAIAAANTNREKIEQQISARQIEADIARQFNGNTDCNQELKRLAQEMAEAGNELAELQRQYKIFTVAKNHLNDACMVSKDTPGYRMRSLHNQLSEETSTFKDDIESKVNVLYEDIDTAVNTIVKASQTIGELSLTAKIRDLELQASGFTETGLQNTLKAIRLKSDLKHMTLQQIVDARRFAD